MSAPPVNVIPCRECGRKFPAKISEIEPLCPVCDGADFIAASDLAAGAQVEITGKHSIRAAVVEHHVPVEYARSAVRPFGLGLGELPASKLTQRLAHDPDDERRSLLGAYVAGSVLIVIPVLIGLIVLAVAGIA